MSAHSHRLEMIREWARHDADTFRSFTSTLARLDVPLASSRVLDIGCGLNAPMTLMLHASGCRVTGIDGQRSYLWGLGIRPRRYLRYARSAGLLRTMRKVAGELVYDRVYVKTLREATGLDLTDEGLDLREMTAEHLHFQDASIDIVHSNATWEHIADVAAANREVARILRPGGIAYIELHLFPSLSGGHDLPWIGPGRTELGNVIPWSHLRNAEWKPPVFLNRLRERAYRRLFDDTPGLEVLEWNTEFTEGEHLVTDEILSDLPDYTREELTRRSLVILARRTGA